jgi:Arc/MetJ-type ribon-helix-helix transcriptional regulator
MLIVKTPRGRVHSAVVTISLKLPKELEERLLAEVRAGRHTSVEDAILEKLSRNEEPDLLSLTGMNPPQLRQDLEQAWSDRHDAVDGEAVFARIQSKSAAAKAQGK